MSEVFDYDCYAYLLLEHGHSTIPIKDAESHLEKIFSLVSGDVLDIDGLGMLQVVIVNVDDYHWRGGGYLYQEISISCRKI